MTSTTPTPPFVRPTPVNPAHLPDTTRNGYSTAVIAPASGRLAFISGQGGHDQTGALSTDFDQQVQQAYANLVAVLQALDAHPDHVVKLTIFVVNHEMSKLRTLTESVTRVFGDRLPAQTLVPVPALAVDGMLFEVEAVVLLP